MQKLVFMLLVCVGVSCGLSRPAHAIKQFSDEFMKLYDVDKSSEDKSELAEKVLKAKCYTCHQGKKKKNRNRYGAELAKLLDKKKDKKDAEKIVAALKKVEEMNIDAKDDKSPTFGDLIKAGKLPGGPLEEVKKEPKAGSDKKGSDKKA